MSDVKRKYAKREEKIFCPNTEERFYLRDCLARHFVARKTGKGRAFCATCSIVASRLGDVGQLRVIRLLTSHQPYFLEVALIARGVSKPQADIDKLLSALAEGGVVESAYVLGRGSRPKKMYRLVLRAGWEPGDEQL